MDSKKLIVLLLVVDVLLGAACYKKATTPVYEPEPPVVEVSDESVAWETVQERPESIDSIDLRTFRLTAYCPCEVCCGRWAKNRPLDENGEPIVIGAWGKPLVDGYSVASPLPFGTQVYLVGIGTVEVQDRTANWVVEKYGEDIIDLYMTDHQEALKFGVQYVRGIVE